jgi:hypothetical protein
VNVLNEMVSSSPNAVGFRSTSLSGTMRIIQTGELFGDIGVLT